MTAVLQGQKRSIKKDISLVKSQIDECDSLSAAHRNKMLSFCISEDISNVLDIDYAVRKKYEGYIVNIGLKKRTSYVNDFDRVIMHHRKKQHIQIADRAVFEYKSDKEVYLPYVVRTDKLDLLYIVQDKRNLVWDFSIRCPKEFKRQFSVMLNVIIEGLGETKDLRQKRRHLITLKYLYEFCNKSKIYDLMDIDKHDENRFELYINETHKYLKPCARVVINFCRKVLFLNCKEINWRANVWYMDRFTLDEARINVSDKINSISFLNVENKDNRHVLQDYVKYMMGLTDLSLSTIRSIEYRIEEFVIQIGEKHIYDVGPDDIDRYIDRQIEVGNSKEFIDRKLVLIDKWYRNILSYGHIKKLPFQLGYYISSKFETTHNDRSVERDIINLIMQNLVCCEEVLRLMFLTQLCTARRISEVCQIKAGKIKKDSGDYWICFYQPKMAADIMVPIPKQLFILLRKHIKIHGISADEYIFQAEDGRIYRSARYQKEMSKFCEKMGICTAGYDFKSHDFRHTIATYMYKYGASLQAIRDFLGHKTDEMTKQYIDFIPMEIEKKSRLLFAEKAGKEAKHAR